MPGAIDYEIGKRLHPEPPTEEELEYMKGIEPTSAGILLHKLHTIASEGNETLVKLGASTGCRWGDTSCAIYTRTGDSAVCASGLYFHAVLGSTDVKYIMKYWLSEPSVGVKPGTHSSVTCPISVVRILRIWAYTHPYSIKISSYAGLELWSIPGNAALANPVVCQPAQGACTRREYRFLP